MTAGSLRGVWAALLTPWDDTGSVDERRLLAEIDSFASGGVHGVYTGGTAGEFYAQDDAMFRRVTELVCDAAHCLRVPVQIGCTALSTRTACQRVGVAREAGADAAQLAIPFWLTLSDEEVVSFFRSVADAADGLPLVLYQTMRAKRRIDPPLLGRLCREVPTLIGIKDTTADLATFERIRRDAPEISIFGADCDLIERVRCGGRGTYSSLVGLSTRGMLEYFDLCERGRFGEAARWQSVFRSLMREVLQPMVREEHLNDSAVDRVQRVAGGGACGLRCAEPYRSATPHHVSRLVDWCDRHAPTLIRQGLIRTTNSTSVDAPSGN